MDDSGLPSQGMVWLLTQGVLGFTTAVGFFVAAYMYRGREADRLRYEATLAAKDQAHDVELAQWQKLVSDKTTEQLTDQRTQNASLASANDLIRQLWQSRAGGSIDKAS